MAFKGTNQRIIIPIVEMTPMIDIVFLLIIFFMVAAQFAQQAHVEINLPEEIGEDQANRSISSLVINILPDGSIIINNTDGVVSLEEIDTIIQAAVAVDGIDWKNITIRADELSEAKSLNKIFTILNSHGLQAANIATESSR